MNGVQPKENTYEMNKSEKTMKQFNIPDPAKHNLYVKCLPSVVISYSDKLLIKTEIPTQGSEYKIIFMSHRPCH